MEPTPDQVDRDLLSRFVKRADRDALGTLARRYEVALLGLAKGLLGGNRALAQEAVQNAWVKVIRYGRSFDGRCALRTWLFRIVINQCRSLRDRERSSAPPGLHDAAVAVQRAHGHAESGGESGEDARRVCAALDALSDAQREVILLCYHAELTHAHAADVIGVPIGTLKSRLHAALEALRGALVKEHAR